uniref:MARVEL domain-containing protein n=1 Tax=Caenorhabditis tropicalis TaxID=1561998 RepID=A0A1I7UUU7_9PELO
MEPRYNTFISNFFLIWTIFLGFWAFFNCFNWDLTTAAACVPVMIWMITVFSFIDFSRKNADLLARFELVYIICYLFLTIGFDHVDRNLAEMDMPPYLGPGAMYAMWSNTAGLLIHQLLFLSFRMQDLIEDDDVPEVLVVYNPNKEEDI